MPRSDRRVTGPLLLATLGALLTGGCSDDNIFVDGVGGSGDAGSNGMAGNGGSGMAGGGGSGGSSGSAGNGGGVSQGVPTLRGEVTLADADLAAQALAALGSPAVGPRSRCGNCHVLDRTKLTHWRDLTSDFVSQCLSEPLVAESQVDAVASCIRARAGSEVVYSPSEFGVYAGAAHLGWFGYVFDHASASVGDMNEALFMESVSMPKAGTPWTQAEFDLVAEWFARGLPEMLTLVPAASGDPCAANVSSLLVDHIAQMATAGWRAVNLATPLLMFGCAEGQVGAQCLSSLPVAVDPGTGGSWIEAPNTTLRLLYDNSATKSAYWSRCSADGRYLGFGRLEGDNDFWGQVVDLAGPATILAQFEYDATFFPDNSGFMAQRSGTYTDSGQDLEPSLGVPEAGGETLFCSQSVLAGAPSTLTGQEAQCNVLTETIGLYQQSARSVSGDDYWSVYGSFVGDNGGYLPTLHNPPAAFPVEARTSFVPLINQGTGFEAGATLLVDTPLQGDPMLSPSGQLLITRAKGPETVHQVGGLDFATADQSGYKIFQVTVGQNGTERTLGVQQVAEICLQGGKPAISYDERWMVVHHYTIESDAVGLGYTDAADPAFAPYAQDGSSDVYLIDLRTGTATRVTRMNPGQYALFPHFRSDGWIYFTVRTLDGTELFLASDAALVAEAANP